MQFLLLAYGNEEKFNRLTEEELAALAERCAAYDEEFRASGKVLGGGSLGWSAKTLRLKAGRLAVTDGPYLETREVVGGLVIFEAEDFEEAVRLASLHPAARMGEELGWAIELRPMEQCILLRQAEGVE
jgi:hypothetical protein